METSVFGDGFSPHFPNPLVVALKLTEHTTEADWSFQPRRCWREYRTPERRNVLQSLRDSCLQVAKHLNTHTKADKHHVNAVVCVFIVKTD